MTQLKQFLKNNILRIIAALYSLALIYPNLKRVFDQHIWMDEAYTAWIVKLTVPELIRATGNDVHPPLYYLIVKLFCNVLGEKVWVLHLASFLAYVILVAFFLIVIWNEFGPMPPFVAITFLSLSDVALKYNVEIRMYALAALFVFLSYYYFYRIVKEDKLLNYILFMIFSLASAYTHYYALIAVAFFYVVLIFYIAVVRRTAFIQIIAIYLITIVAYLPWLRILIASVQNRVDNYWIEDIPTLGACFSFMVSEHFQNWMWGITICVFILAVLYQSGIVTVEKQDKKEYTLKVLQRPHGSAVLLLLLAGMASIVGTAAVGIILSKVLSPFFVTRYMYVVCPVWWFVLGVIFSKLKLSPVWTIPFLCYMMTYFIPAYQAIAGYDEYINNRTLLVLNTLDSIPEEDILIGNYSGNDVHLLGDYYLEGRQTLYIDYDLYSAQLPELNPSQQYWLIVNDDWDLTYLFEQFAAQGYECTNVLPDGLIAYGNVYIYRVDAVASEINN